MEIPFIGGAYKGRSTELNSQECVNLYPIIDQTGAKNLIALFGTPGLTTWYDSGYYKPVRGLHVMGDRLFVIIGDTISEIDLEGNYVKASGYLTTTTGPVWMVDNGTYLVFIDPGVAGYYVQKGGNLTEIVDADFPTPRALTFIQGYFVVSEDGTNKWYISGLNDPINWDALDYETAERQPDNIVAMTSIKGQIVLMGPKSIEIWAHTGAAEWPFGYVGLVDQGIDAPFSIVRDEQGIFFVSSRKEVVMSVGYDLMKISTDALDYQINTYSKTDDAIAYIYSQEGHRFYVLTFPEAGKTWAYDITTQLWHERRSKALSVTASDIYGRHWSTYYALFGGKHIVGGLIDGKLYQMQMDVYTDAGNPILRRRAAQTIQSDQKINFFHSFEIDFEGGVGLNVGQGYTPYAMLQWSDDGGFTWSNEHWASIGRIGAYKTRARWNKLGRGRNRVFRVTITDPVKIVIINAHLESSQGRT